MGCGFLVLEYKWCAKWLYFVQCSLCFGYVLEEEVCTENVTGIFNKHKALLLEKLI